MEHACFRGACTIALLACVGLIPGCATAPEFSSLWQHPEYAKPERMGRVIAVLPPDVELLERTAQGTERNKGREETIGNQLHAAVMAALAKQGFAPQAALLKQSEGNESEFKFRYDKLMAEFEIASRTHNLIDTEAILARKERIGVGQAAKEIAAAHGSDMLAVVRYRGWDDSDRSSGAAMAGGIVAGALLGVATGFVIVPTRGSSQTTLTIEVGLIDARSGDLVWLRSSIFRTVDLGQQALQSALDSLPAAFVSTPSRGKP